MEVLYTINEYIKYAYYLLALVIIVLFVLVIKQLIPLSKTLEYISNELDDINSNAKDIEIKINKIKYTLEHSVPFFAFLLFIIIVIISAIRDYFNTKHSKRSITKSLTKEYGIVNLKFNPKKTRKYRKEFVSQMKKLA